MKEKSFLLSTCLLILWAILFAYGLASMNKPSNKPSNNNKTCKNFFSFSFSQTLIVCNQAQVAFVEKQWSLCVWMCPWYFCLVVPVELWSVKSERKQEEEEGERELNIFSCLYFDIANKKSWFERAKGRRRKEVKTVFNWQVQKASLERENEIQNQT